VPGSEFVIPAESASVSAFSVPRVSNVYAFEPPVPAKTREPDDDEGRSVRAVCSPDELLNVAALEPVGTPPLQFPEVPQSPDDTLVQLSTVCAPAAAADRHATAIPSHFENPRPPACRPLAPLRPSLHRPDATHVSPRPGDVVGIIGRA
jgi:hypothetical protein